MVENFSNRISQEGTEEFVKNTDLLYNTNDIDQM